MAHPSAPKTLLELNTFKFQNILNEDPLAHSIALLGTFPASQTDAAGERVQAIVRLEKTTFGSNNISTLLEEAGKLDKIRIEGSTNIYTWLFGWLGSERDSDVKISIVCPATEVHIRKYMRQDYIMVQETPLMYKTIVEPYIQAFPPSRTQWVENILNGISEQSKILYSSSEFLILPDMKWDLTNLSSLYLLALVHDCHIKSLRDLRKTHLPLLRAIQTESQRIVHEKWGLAKGSLRMYIHYQPSYYHFHVHIVNVNYQGAMLGMTVGQAHLLDDVISVLELDPDDGPGIFERMTLTYGLGDQHGLFEAFRIANAGN